MVGITDSRDCAMAHLQALKVDSAKNQRFLVISQDMFFLEIADALRGEFGASFKDIPTRSFWFCLIKLLSHCDKRATFFRHIWGVETRHDCSKSKEMLGL